MSHRPRRATAHYGCGSIKTISIAIDEPLLSDLDRAARKADKTRSELFRLALQEWLDDQRRRELAAHDRAGYHTHPVRPGEFEGLIAAQAVEMPEPPAALEGGDDS